MDLNSPSGTAALAGVLFSFVEVLKTALGIDGSKVKVRWLAIVLGVVLGFGTALFSKDPMPALTPSFLWNTFVNTFLMIGVAFGIHQLRGDGTPATIDPGNPLAPVQKAVDQAQKATDTASAALDKVQSEAGKAAAVVDAVEKVAPALTGVVNIAGALSNLENALPPTAVNSDENTTLSPPPVNTGKNDKIPE